MFLFTPDLNKLQKHGSKNFVHYKTMKFLTSNATHKVHMYVCTQLFKTFTH